MDNHLNHSDHSSTNASYCEADDKGCAQCRNPGNDSPPLLCVGLNDCVCTSQCEWQHWKQDRLANSSLSLATQISTVSRMLEDKNRLIEPLKKFIIFLEVLFPTAVVALLIWSWRMGNSFCTICPWTSERD